MALARELHERLADIDVTKVTVKDGDYKGTPARDVDITIGDKVHKFQFAKNLKLDVDEVEAIVRSYIKHPPGREPEG